MSFSLLGCRFIDITTNITICKRCRKGRSEKEPPPPAARNWKLTYCIILRPQTKFSWKNVQIKLGSYFPLILLINI